MSEEHLTKLQEAMLDHKKKLETDPEYRKRCEELRKELDKVLTSWPNDTED